VSSTDRPAASLPVFLAHAIALERESAERFEELADSLEVHHAGEVVQLFRKMAHYSRLHLEDVQAQARDVDLPRLAPWEFRWPDAEAPETVEVEAAHYKMTPHHALVAALDSEKRGQAFYAGVAEEAADDHLRRLAAAFADEEGDHVALLEAWLEKYPPPPPDWDEDMDPPVSVD